MDEKKGKQEEKTRISVILDKKDGVFLIANFDTKIKSHKRLLEEILNKGRRK